MPKHIDLDPALARLRRVFSDADIAVAHLQVVGVSGKFPGTEITFVVDLGYPEKFHASFFVSNAEISNTRSNASLALIVSQRTNAAVQYLLQETGRRE
jgi:hypothetical protein